MLYALELYHASASNPCLERQQRQRFTHESYVNITILDLCVGEARVIKPLRSPPRTRNDPPVDTPSRRSQDDCRCQKHHAGSDAVRLLGNGEANVQQRGPRSGNRSLCKESCVCDAPRDNLLSNSWSD